MTSVLTMIKKSLLQLKSLFNEISMESTIPNNFIINDAENLASWIRLYIRT